MSQTSDESTTLSPLKRALRALEDMQVRLEAAEQAPREPIAVIGTSCIMPGGAESPEEFWEVLRSGKDCVTEVPPDRFDIDSYYDPRPATPGKTNTRFGAFVDKIQDFDPAFAGVAPKNAYSVDPQQRLLGAVAWAALEDAGIAPLSLEGSQTGVYVGIWNVDYWQRLASRDPEELDANVIGGNTHSVASGAISYLLGLRGPSMAIDTACSSSLVTVDLACQGLRSGASDLALAGGVNVIIGPENYVCLSATQVLAPDGRCKTFDAAADGFTRGEGCGFVVLKRLRDAVRDDDRILAVVHASCVNQDGKTSGITVPNGPSQEDAVRRALAQAGLRPADVQFVEAHGTGTALGDPIEVGALAKAYGPGRSQDDPLLIGSVKSNIGHLESAAGVAGLIKTILCLQHEEIPANLHFKNPNPRIPWDELPVKVVSEPTPWPRGPRPRYAAVSSFGASGTNAHLLLGEAPLKERSAPLHPERSLHVLTFSAKSGDAVPRGARRLAGHLEAHPDLELPDVCFTANVGRSPFKHRLAVVASTAAEAQGTLAALAQGAPAPAAIQGRVRGTASPPLAFVFTGQGSQHVGMGRGLYETQPVFRQALDRCDEILVPLMGKRLVDVIHTEAEGTDSPLDETTWTQPALFALEYSLAAMWRSWGVEPRAVMGHSVGEYVAACVAGVFGLEDGLKLIAARGRLMGALPQEGAMVAVLSNEARVKAAVEPHAALVSIAALNGPENVVISGQDEAVLSIASAFEAEGVETRRLNVSHAFHSPLMEPILGEFERVAREVDYEAPEMTLVSNLTGAEAGDEVALPEYWIRHVSQTVMFKDAVKTLHAGGIDLFLEVGPKPVLTGMGTSCLPSGVGTWLPTLRPGQGDEERAFKSLAELWVRGVPVDWAAFDEGRGRARVALPTYPFGGDRYWIEADAPSSPKASGNWLEALLAARAQGRLQEPIREAGGFSEDESRLLARLLDVFAEEYESRSAPSGSLVADYYNAIPSAADQLDTGSREEQAERYLTFGPLHDPVPGFSWVKTFADPVKHAEWAQLCFDSQKEMRQALFRHIDFQSCRSALDFGCGYGSDLVSLAQAHPHLSLTGYTIAREQARIGQGKVEAQGLGDRVRIFNRDSANDEFPDEHDLIFGFEVAHHVPNKRALFGNIGRHLREGGHLVLADFISRAGFSIDHDATSSFFVTKDEWSDLLAENHIQVVDCVDISQEIANFLHDPDFDENLAQIDPFKADANIRAGFKSYDQLGKLLRQGLTDYVLMTSRKRGDLSVAELVRLNHEVLASPTPYGQVALAGACYEVTWEASEATNLPGGNGRPRRWVILSDSGGVGQALADDLSAAGDKAVVVTAGEALVRQGPNRWVANPRERGDLARVLSESAESLAGVVHLWTLDTPSSDDLTGEAVAESQALGWESVLGLVQTMAADRPGGSSRIWLVTRQAQAVDGVAPEVAAAPLVGMGKSFALEHPELWGGMVDIDSTDPGAIAPLLRAELSAPAVEQHVAYRDGARRVARLARRPQPPQVSPPVSGEASYLITGGLGALGLRVAGWLASEGARHLVLVGRSEPGAAAREAIDALARDGLDVLTVRADVSQEDDVAALMKALEGRPPLKGVVHAAGVLDDGVLLQQDAERFQKVLAPKLQGSLNLHRVTRERELDFFVCFSSAASLFGSPGQGNYAAANAFMDALAHRRRAQGLPGLSVNWGAWAGTGMAAQLTTDQRRQLAERGVGEIEPEPGLRLLGSLMAEGPAQVGVSPMSWRRYFDGAALEEIPPYFQGLAPVTVSTSAKTRGSDVKARLAEAGGEQRAELLSDYLVETVGRILGHPDPGKLDRELTLLEMGFDSLMAVQLRNALRSDLDADLPIGKLFDSTSVESLLQLLGEALDGAAPRSEPPPPSAQGGDVHVEMI